MMIRTVCVLGLLLMPASLMAQDIVDGFFRAKGDLVVALSFGQEEFDDFYRGTDKTSLPAGLNEYKTESSSIFAAYGINENLEVVANIPYLAAEADALPVVANPPAQRQSGFQDIETYLKWRPWRKSNDGGEASLVTAVGAQIPLSDYEANQPVSIGDDSTNFGTRLGFMYQWYNGLSANLQGGYIWKSDDVPDSYVISSRLGYGKKRFFGDVWGKYSKATDGTDIGQDGFSFPANRVEVSSMGVGLYYSVVESFGVTVKASRVLDGRNVGDGTTFSGGFVYSF